MSQDVKKSEHGDLLRRMVAAGGGSAARRRRLHAIAAVCAAAVQKGLRDYWGVRISASPAGAEEAGPEQLAACAAGAAYHFRIGENDLFVVLDNALVATAVGWELAGELCASEEAPPCAAIDRRLAQSIARVVALGGGAIVGEDDCEPHLVAALESLAEFEFAPSDNLQVSASAMISDQDDRHLGAATIISPAPRSFAAEPLAGAGKKIEADWRRAIEKAAFACKADIRVIVSRRTVDYGSLSCWAPGHIIPFDGSAASRAELVSVSHGRCQVIAAGQLLERNGRRALEVSSL